MRNAEGCVSLLPCKILHFGERFMNPFRRSTFDVLKDVHQSSLLIQNGGDMQMIIWPVCDDHLSVHLPDDSADVWRKARHHFIGHERLAILGGKDQMVIQIDV